MALNFMVHCGGKEVERSAITEIALPEQTQTYCPVPHNDFANIIQDTLGDFGYEFGQQAHALNKEGAQYFGMAELLGPVSGTDEWNLVAGWRSSYDRSLSASFVIGSQVFVCDNLAFSGEVQIGRKHTPKILQHLPDLIRGAVERTRGMAEQQAIRYETYQQQIISDAVANDAIVQMLQQGVYPSKKISQIVKEYHEPTHREHLNSAGHKTVWTLFNAVTESIKGANIAQLPKRTINLHNMMDVVAEIKIAA